MTEADRVRREAKDLVRKARTKLEDIVHDLCPGTDQLPDDYLDTLNAIRWKLVDIEADL